MQERQGTIPADKNIYLFKGFNAVFRSILTAYYQPMVANEPITKKEDKLWN